jgi:hypothetical protein
MLKTFQLSVFFLGIFAGVYSEAKDPRQNATYFVPTTDPSLEAFANTSVEIKWRNLKPGHRVFSYDLPAELDGIGQEIRVREVSPSVFEGPKASGTCLDNNLMSCTMKYRNLLSNQDAAINKIISTYSNVLEQESRIKIMKAFQFDPEAGGIWTATEAIHK